MADAGKGFTWLSFAAETGRRSVGAEPVGSTGVAAGGGPQGRRAGGYAVPVALARCARHRHGGRCYPEILRATTTTAGDM